MLDEITATGFDVDANGKWQGMIVEYYDPPSGPSIEGDGGATVEGDADSGYTITPGGENKAVVKPEVVEALLVEDEAEVSIGGEEPLIRTAETKPGLTYHFREGTSLEAMRADTPLSKAGDGQAWEPTITVKDPDSAFYELKITW